MHATKIDVKWKIYLVSIEKFDNRFITIHYSVSCCRLFTARLKISSNLNENDSCYSPHGLLSCLPFARPLLTRCFKPGRANHTPAHRPLRLRQPSGHIATPIQPSLHCAPCSSCPTRPAGALDRYLIE